MPNPFPPIDLKNIEKGGEDRNPAVQLFGRRFFADQTVPELLVELLLVASSGKKIADTLIPEEHVLPDLDSVREWPIGAHLEYAPKARLNLKLFSFLGASKLETRHESHQMHYKDLLTRIKSQEHLNVSDATDKMEVLRTLENLFLGFQGVGAKRTWCAQSFLPVNKQLIAGESIWKETRAKADSVDHWDQAIKYFSQSQAIFLSRGGELLYLQLCNALRQDKKNIINWCRDSGLSLSESEQEPSWLYSALERSFNKVFSVSPEAISKLACFVDSGVDAETSKRTDTKNKGSLRYTNCGWCPEESWPEGFLFSVEFIRICDSEIDPIHRLELLQIACAMQVLRSICAQSARYIFWPESQKNSAGPLSYVWAISDPEGNHNALKQISRRSASANQRMIYEAVRHPIILDTLKSQQKHDEAKGQKWKDPYSGANGADSRYGHKLFITIAKRIGLIVPKRGAGARFVLNDQILRFLVMALIRPGKRITYETFKKLIFLHYGIALDDYYLSKACSWSGTSQLTTLGGKTDAWVVDMLDAAGMLLRLSDSCSLVTNPFNGGKQ